MSYFNVHLNECSDKAVYVCMLDCQGLETSIRPSYRSDKIF